MIYGFLKVETDTKYFLKHQNSFELSTYFSFCDMWILLSKYVLMFSLVINMQLFACACVGIFVYSDVFFSFAANITQRNEVIMCVQRDMAED